VRQTWHRARLGYSLPATGDGLLPLIGDGSKGSKAKELSPSNHSPLLKFLRRDLKSEAFSKTIETAFKEAECD
jgi:hypothetical protein